MAFTTLATLKTSLAAMMKLASSSDLAAYWDTLLTDGQTAAYNEIVGQLATRGYTKTQIDLWDRGVEFEKDLALFWGFTRGAGLHGVDDKWINKLDRRQELTVVVVTTSGAIVSPAGFDRIGFGDQKDTQSTFKYRVDSAGKVDKTEW